MGGAKYNVGDTIQYHDGTDNRLGVIQVRTFDPKSMDWKYRVAFYDPDSDIPASLVLSGGELTQATMLEHYDAHYQGDVQPIELMQSAMSTEAFMGFLRGNIIKYACRLGKKDDVAKETTKILRYAEWLDKVAKGKKVNPRE
jgi:hypothetical protein